MKILMMTVEKNQRVLSVVEGRFSFNAVGKNGNVCERLPPRAARLYEVRA